MRVRTEQGQEFNFTLSGNDTQDNVNFVKYRELAYGAPRGSKLSQLVEDKWLDWVETVDEAPWLRNWTRSVYHAKNRPAGLLMGHTPLGQPVDTARCSQPYIASALYAEAVWGYGVLGWTATEPMSATAKGRTSLNSALKCICRLQGIKCPNEGRMHLYDEPIYRGTGLIVPCEFGTLDRWLEQLWYDVCQG